MTADRPSRDKIELELFGFLGNMDWHDITDAAVVEFDEPIAKAYIAGHRRLPQMFMVVRWADGAGSVAALSDRHPGEWRSIPSEAYKAEWLLEVIEGRRPA